MPLSSEYVFVDLDGTLIHTDLTRRGVCEFVKGKPWRWLTLFAWFLRGRGYLKPRLAQFIKIDPASLPYCPVIQKFMAAEKTAGKKIILATASPQVWADQVARHIGGFDGVIATSNGINMRAHAKLKAMQEMGKGKSIAYMGNSWVDDPVFAGCDEAILIHGPKALEDKLLKSHPRATILSCAE